MEGGLVWAGEVDVCVVICEEMNGVSGCGAKVYIGGVGGVPWVGVGSAGKGDIEVLVDVEVGEGGLSNGWG